MSLTTRRAVPRPVEAPVLGRLLTGRLVAGPGVGDALRVATGLAAEGRAVALEHRPGAADDVAGELGALVAGARAAAVGDCEVTLPVDRLTEVPALAADAARAGLGVALEGSSARVDALLVELPAARAVVSSGEADAVGRCRALAGGRVRLRAGRGAAARRAFVRCLDVLMAGDGAPAVATSDPRLIAVAGERAAWHGRTYDTWEHVMPWRIRPAEQQRIAASGAALRIAVPSGRGAVAGLAATAGGLR
ncbi:hypothetical protein JKP75_16895 [Blastococcus sp. TML/M2B]|uniref:hypothetical protein n=1 Tax=unclassified Blastococcus TaxID=2619396 RepID=UPI00190D4351|nr:MULTISPECIES: hypothetical protein [unclassified Blastococcus]MBN1094082.1 hypothetical protein [Blastococcus sp. TML/M2B]MBN1095797.1 hypothetical protein [Blastococcus sp. TML/C7B]